MTTQQEEHTLSHYLCIGCPMGCRLEVEADDGEIVEVRGFSCQRGENYAKQEFVEPRRMVTTTVKINHSLWARIPVKTVDAIPKERVQDLCDALHRIQLEAPVEMGDVILEDALGTGINVVASRSMPRTAEMAKT
ncbi:DUF1667 domain-containing protein [Spirulina sp. CS-785/01]|uniref:DUF1667 domain-containing protein n=1 Tax=Spirulina sp. CS-785/01 TaxID=3021716 RepID=UPI0023307B4B|nr:DUF1667 domain-containing protein [Spirulina sp. CS-785/01]MDB9312512.1 DUF1667 domain-containing protein [Spirulina sp. CS-785/01]